MRMSYSKNGGGGGVWGRVVGLGEGMEGESWSQKGSRQCEA